MMQVHALQPRYCKGCETTKINMDFTGTNTRCRECQRKKNKAKKMFDVSPISRRNLHFQLAAQGILECDREPQERRIPRKREREPLNAE